jgi:hypothetical protein
MAGTRPQQLRDDDPGTMSRVEENICFIVTCAIWSDLWALNTVRLVCSVCTLIPCQARRVHQLFTPSTRPPHTETYGVDGEMLPPPATESLQPKLFMNQSFRSLVSRVHVPATESRCSAPHSRPSIGDDDPGTGNTAPFPVSCYYGANNGSVKCGASNFFNFLALFLTDEKKFAWISAREVYPIKRSNQQRCKWHKSSKTRQWHELV